MAASRGTVASPACSSAPGSGLAKLTARPYRALTVTRPAARSPAGAQDESDEAVTTLARVKYMCESCGYVYDPAEGDPDGGIPPGTAFEDIPETWFCPVCGARKRDFAPYEE